MNDKKFDLPNKKWNTIILVEKEILSRNTLTTPSRVSWRKNRVINHCARKRMQIQKADKKIELFKLLTSVWLAKLESAFLRGCRWWETSIENVDFSEEQKISRGSTDKHIWTLKTATASTKWTWKSYRISRSHLADSSYLLMFSKNFRLFTLVFLLEYQISSIL